MPDSLPEAEVEAVPSTDTNTQGDTSATPTESQGEGGLLEAVQAALKTPEAAPAAETSSEKPEAAPAEAKVEDDLTDAEKANLAPRTRARIETLARERNELRAQLEPLREKAERLDRVEAFIDSNGLDRKDVDIAFEILVDISRNPSRALERLQPLYETLRAATGHVLPEDLQKEVQLGYVTEPRAQEIARLRAEKAISEHVSRDDSNRAQAQQARQQLSSSVDAVTTWEARQRASDPDWPLKADFVRTALEAELRALTYVPSPDEAIRLVEAKKKEVEDRLKSFRAPAKAVNPVTKAVGSASQPAPKTMMDVVRLSIGQT